MMSARREPPRDLPSSADTIQRTDSGGVKSAPLRSRSRGVARLAIDGGPPVRQKMLPYARQTIDEDDIAAVVEVLRSDWLTTGPKIEEFEAALAKKTESAHGVAVSSGTAALHAAMEAIGVKSGDEVIVPAITFAASANCVVFQGSTPVFADVDPDTLLIDPEDVAAKITSKTKAIMAVDYAGQPCDYDSLKRLTAHHDLALVADASHALGAKYKGRSVGSLADLTTFSFHAVKHITTGEGGAITTDDARLARRMRMFRNHGMTSDHRERQKNGSWVYEMADLGFNYRLTDIQCALGITQLNKLDGWVSRRRQIAHRYDEAFSEIPAIEPLKVGVGTEHAYHLYVFRLQPHVLRVKRERIFAALRAEGIGVNVHYIPVHLHQFYRERFDTVRGLCPVAETAYENIISLPLFPAMNDRDIDDVIEAVGKVTEGYRL
jgi:perosamine synthetase